VYSTYLGGSGDEQGLGIAVDPYSNAYVVGTTSSPDFPTLNAFQPMLGGIAGSTNAFVTSLDPTGQLRYSTYLGGGADFGGGIAVDAAGNAYITGGTGSPHFPTVNPLQATLKGSSNAFVAELSADGSALVYSTYLGGRGGYEGDYGRGIAVDQYGQIFVTGTTGSPDFPTLNAIQPRLGGAGKALQNAFVTSLSPGGGLLYSTYLGGSIVDIGSGIAVDAAGNTYVSGVTYSPDFPTVNALQPAPGGPFGNAFVAEISPGGTPPPAAQFQVSAPAQVRSHTAFAVTVTAQATNGLTAVGYQGTVTLSTTDTDPRVVLPGSYTFTAADQGVHTFRGCILITAGSQTIIATDTTDATITGTATITVNAGP
jgi:hypothetical protein